MGKETEETEKDGRIELKVTGGPQGKETEGALSL